MSEGIKRRNPLLGTVSYRLRDSKGRFTSDFRKARFFSFVFGNKADSKSRPFKPDAKNKEQKLAQMVLEAHEVYERMDKKRSAKQIERERKTGKETKRPRGPKSGYATTFLEELKNQNKKLHRATLEAFAAKPKKRYKLAPTKKAKKGRKELRAVDDGTLISRAYKLAGEILRSTRSIHPDHEDSVERLFSQFIQAELSTEGVRTKTKQIEIRTPTGQRKKIWVRDDGPEGNPFMVAEEAGIRQEEHLWWIAREYLRTLGYDYFVKLGRRLGTGPTMLLGVGVSTNIEGMDEPQWSHPAALKIRLNKKSVADQKAEMDSLTYQLVRALVQAINGVEAATENSVLSSGKCFVRPLENVGPRGQKSTKKKAIRVIFTLFVD
jgi:hypothetical protein